MQNPSCLEIASESLDRMKASRERVDRICSSNKAVYGINTGFGSLASVHISSADLSQLQTNLIRSHAVGVGAEFDPEIVRGILLLRSNTLCQGFSGIRPLVVKTIVDLLNHDILPIIPQIGSLGASGDLAPLSHMALALLGEGQVRYQNQLLPALEALRKAGIQPVSLEAKEGLALINGTPAMTAVAIKSLAYADFLIRSSDLIGAMSVEALRGTNRAFHPSLHQLRPHPGQARSAKNLWLLLQDSQNMQAHKDCGKVQDAYSLRCMPQVHGACYDALSHTSQIVGIELNSVTDNPIVFEDDVISGGNFHGEPIALAMAYLSMALCETGSISERRQNRLVNPVLSGLPAFLTAGSGLNSGFMIAHYTSAAIVCENRVLVHPAAVDSIPTSADQEDHVSLATTTARNCLTIAENLAHLLAIEALMALQGMRLLGPTRFSLPVQALFDSLSREFEPLNQDRVLTADINLMRQKILSGELIAIVSSAGVEL